MQKTNTVKILAFLAILFLALAVAGCTKPQNQNASPTPSVKASATLKPSPSPTPFSAKQDYDYGKYVMHSERLTTAPDANAEGGESTDEEWFTNEGPEPAKFSVAEVFPQTKLSDADASAEKNGKTLETRHLVLNPLTQLTDVALDKNERASFSARSQKKDFANNAPVRLLADSDLTAFQRSKLLPALSKIAELNLGLPQARAFEKTVNGAFAKIKQQQNPFEDYVDAVEDYVDEIHDEIEEAERASPTPRPTPKIQQIKFPTPSPPKQPTKEELSALLPQMPATLEFKLSEKKLSEMKPVYLQPKSYLGSVLYSVEGGASPYLSVSAETMGNTYVLFVRANVRRTLVDKKIPFDSKKGKLSASFSLVPDYKIFTEISIEVSHTEESEETIAEEEETVNELPTPTPSPTPSPSPSPGTKPQPVEKIAPDEAVAQPNTEPVAPERKVYENYEKVKVGEVKKLTIPMTGHPDVETVQKYHPEVIEAYNALCRRMGYEPKSAGCRITNGYRDPEYNAEIDGAKDSAHMYALALDLQVGGWKKQLEWVEAAQGIFSRVGVYCDKDIIHVDMMSDRCPYVRKNGHDTCTYDLESQKSTAQQQCG